MSLERITGPIPCERCGSLRHGTLQHLQLEAAARKLVPWPIVHIDRSTGDPALSDVEPHSIRYMHSRLEIGSVHVPLGHERHDQIAKISEQTALVRVWNPDPAGGVSVMLSFDNDDSRALGLILGAVAVPGSVTIRVGAYGQEGPPR